MCNKTGIITNSPCINKNWNFNATSPCPLTGTDESAKIKVKISARYTAFTTRYYNYTCYHEEYIYVKWGKGSPDPQPKPDP